MENTGAENILSNKLSLASKVAGVGIWEYSFPKNKFKADEVLLQHHGLTFGDFSGAYEELLEFIHPEDKERVILEFRDALNNGSEILTEYRIILGDGSVHFIKVAAILEWDEPGNLSGLFGTAQDVTISNKTRLQLSNNENFISGVLNSLSDNIAVIDGIGNIVAVNESWKRFAMENGESTLCRPGTGANYFNVCNKAAGLGQVTAAEVLVGIKDIIDNRKADFYIEYPCRPQNEERWFAMRAVKLENHKHMVVVSHQDITERKTAERLLRENESKFRSFFTNCMDAMLLTVTDGEIIEANPAACTMFQMTEEEICNAGRFALVDHTDPRLASLITERQRTGRAKGEITLLRKDGSEFPAELTAAMFKDGGGRERTSMTIRDMTERKLAVQELNTTAKKLQDTLKDLTKIMNSSLDIICSVDEEGRFVTVSAAAEKTWGYQPEELAGRKYLELVFHEDVRNSIISEAEIKSGVPVTIFENRFVHKDGGIVPMLWSARWDDKDKLTYCIGKDATDKKRLEKVVAVERQRFDDLYSQAPCCMGILKGPDHVYEMANPLYLKLIDKKDIIGKKVIDVLPELAEQGIFEFLDTVYNTGQTFSANEMLVKFDRFGTAKLVDTYLNFIYQAHRNNEGDIDGILFFVIDVTEQVLAGKKINESEKRYRQIVETAQEGIWKIDEENKTTFVNDKICEILAYSKEEMLGKDIFFFMDDEGRKIGTKFLQKKRSGYSEQFQFKYISKTGREVWTHVSANPLFDESGIYKGALAMIADITGSKLAEVERDKLVDDLIVRNTALEQFAYIVSHNLRAPVANIIGASNALKDNDLSPIDTEILNRGIRESVMRLNDVVTDLNNILDVKSDIDGTKEIIVFSELLEHIKISIKDLIDKHDIKIKCDFSEIDEFFTLKAYMHSIFYNLISNSIKYRQLSVPSVIEIKTRRVKNKLELIFIDNGTGINLEKKGKQIFGLYQRFHQNIKGKGMGLFMVKTQVETLGGKIGIQSEENVGTEFKIEFDLY